MPAATVEQIAEDLKELPPSQAGWNQVLLRHCATKVLKVSEPPMEGDGVMSAEALLGNRVDAETPMLEVIPDWTHHLDDIIVDGNVITIEHSATGTFPGGESFRAQAKYVLTIEDGLIVKIVLVHDPAFSEKIMNAVPSLLESVKDLPE